jgi:hypothetical protein
LGKRSAVFGSNRVQMGGLSAVTAGVLLLILDAWGLVLELLGAYPETFSEEAPTTYAIRSASGLAFGFILSTTVCGLSWALFGVALLRARTYPRVATIHS